MRLWLVIILLLALGAPAAAQTPTSAPTPASAPEVAARRATRPPVIDGDVLDPEWAEAATFGDFVQYQPRRGDRATVRTEILVLHDATHLYVAMKAWDDQPVTAQLTRRDADLLGDDAAILVLDTMFDRRSGYYFITNALGTQADGRIGDDGRSLDSSWDTSWQSAAKLTDFGWTAEFRIPLASIRYAAG